MAVNNITPTTGAALRKVFQLLEENFDGSNGQYSNGYDDAKIAKETGVSEKAVKDYRTSAFGKLKPPTDLEILKQEVGELETFFLKTESEMREKIKDAKQRILQLQRKFD